MRCSLLTSHVSGSLVSLEHKLNSAKLRGFGRSGDGTSGENDSTSIVSAQLRKWPQYGQMPVYPARWTNDEDDLPYDKGSRIIFFFQCS